MKSNMKILLLDLDVNKSRRSFPNLALMKLSAYHKARGDEVHLNAPLFGYDKVYASCVFTWNVKQTFNIPPETCLGGSGYSFTKTLPSEVEHLRPDYDLYPGVDFSMGFTSRGCIRRCPWCIVPMKEGRLTPWATIDEFWDHRHQKVKLLDNNFLAQPNADEILVRLAEERLEVDFNQGLDIRLVDERLAPLLTRVKTATLRFSFDDMAYEDDVRAGIKLLLEHGVRSRHLSFYVLFGFKDSDCIIERMKILADLNVDVYPMPYRGADGKEPHRRNIFDGETFWHGAYRNKMKFLRLVGRLPE